MDDAAMGSHSRDGAIRIVHVRLDARLCAGASNRSVRPHPRPHSALPHPICACVSNRQRARNRRDVRLDGRLLRGGGSSGRRLRLGGLHGHSRLVLLVLLRLLLLLRVGHDCRVLCGCVCVASEGADGGADGQTAAAKDKGKSGQTNGAATVSRCRTHGRRRPRSAQPAAAAPPSPSSASRPPSLPRLTRVAAVPRRPTKPKPQNEIAWQTDTRQAYNKDQTIVIYMFQCCWSVIHLSLECNVHICLFELFRLLFVGRSVSQSAGGWVEAGRKMGVIECVAPSASFSWC